MARAIIVVSLFGLIASGVFGQANSKPSTFETASITRSPSGVPRNEVRVHGDNLTAKNLTLKQLLAYAYELPSSQISGPNWTETQGYDVSAKANHPSEVQFQSMLRRLLEDHFKLRTHRERKEIPAYYLVIAKGGPKLRDVKEEEAFNSSYAEKSPFKPGFLAIFSNKDLPGFAERLGRPMERPLLDKTGITGRYWFQLEWPLEPGQTGQEPYLKVTPALRTALQEQVGLKLEQGTARVEILVIDSASAN